MNECFNFIKNHTYILATLVIFAILIPGFKNWEQRKQQYPLHIAGIWEPEGTIDEDYTNELLLNSFREDPQSAPPNVESVTKGTAVSNLKKFPCDTDTARWEATKTAVKLYCAEKLINTFIIERNGVDINLRDTATNIALTRRKATQFEYDENGEHKRLTLYEIPSDAIEANSGYLWGVFEKKEASGKFKIIVSTPPRNYEGHIGRVSTASVESPTLTAWEKEGEATYPKITYARVQVGPQRMAILFPGFYMHQGIISFGGWLLEYTNNSLNDIGSFLFHSDNTPSECYDPKVNKNEYFTDPCFSFDSHIEILKDHPASNDRYYTIKETTVGTNFDYELRKLMKINKTIFYSFNSESKEYAETN